MTAYKIRDWSRYENNRTRDMKQMQWLAVPVKLDGNGFCALMELDDGPAIYGAWIAILQIAAKCEPRGSLVRGNGQPHDFKSIARLARMPKELIERALRVLSGGVEPDIDWVESSVEIVQTAEIPQAGAEIPQESAECAPYNTLQGNTEQRSHTPRAYIREDGRSAYPDLDDFCDYALMHFDTLRLERSEWVEMYKEISGAGWADSQGRPWINWKSKLGFFARSWIDSRKRGQQKPGAAAMLNKNISIEQMTAEVDFLTSRPRETQKGVLRI